ncbi:MAG TPA: tetratricopeptide repeat protein, partial [Terracidiphilus sp.]|nr:tetratricopeptide repeat protein [Terracidiphilus sp.]
YKDSNVAAAEKGFQHILDRNPKSALAEAGMGSAYFTQYNTTHDPQLLALAKSFTSRAIEMDPSLAPPYVTEARMSAAAGQTALATEQAQKALSLDPRSAEAYGALAQVYHAQGRTGDAITAIQKAIDLAPEDSASIWVVKLGSYYYAKGDLANAAAQWKKGLEIDPANVNARYNLGLVNIQLGKLQDARSDFEKVVAMQPSAASYSALGSVLMLEGKYAAAIAMNQKAVGLNPKEHTFWANLASAYEWSGNQDKALQSYAKAIDLAEAQRSKMPNDANLLSALAGYYASSGKPDLSLPLVRKSLALAPNNPPVVYRAGETYELLGQRAKAIPLIAQALALGYDANEFQLYPRLASLRADPAFQAALAKARAEQKK